ncbi:hypothetical protein C8F04DRAFT_1182321 [Mycena alexandri]|uniref:Uncharacterized protein n=1 Tax=Mycena alexandri TaxID=1745969 RepID=A0AAD6T125_9AGAR|nr:hypothetical protein C8F04DRAFT_1182321 [Mycena alexandri]
MVAWVWPAETPVSGEKFRDCKHPRTIWQQYQLTGLSEPFKVYFHAANGLPSCLNFRFTNREPERFLHRLGRFDSAVAEVTPLGAALATTGTPERCTLGFIWVGLVGGPIWLLNGGLSTIPEKENSGRRVNVEVGHVQARGVVVGGKRGWHHAPDIASANIGGVSLLPPRNFEIRDHSQESSERHAKDSPEGHAVAKEPDRAAGDYAREIECGRHYYSLENKAIVSKSCGRSSTYLTQEAGHMLSPQTKNTL